MALEHNAISYGTSISKAGASAFGLAEGEGGVSRLSETLGVQADLWSRPEWALLRGEIAFARHVFVAAVALRFSAIELTLDAGENKLLVVKEITSTLNAIDIVIDNGVAIVANPVVNRGVPLDHRYPNVGEVSRAAVTTGDLAAGAVLPQIQRNANIPATQGWVLNPGGKLFIIANVVATAISVSLAWTERSPFPGELQARG